MERIPILRMGDCLLVTIQVDMHDRLAITLQDDIMSRIADTRARGLIVDISALEVWTRSSEECSATSRVWHGSWTRRRSWLACAPRSRSHWWSWVCRYRA